MSSSACADVDKKNTNHVLFRTHSACLRIDDSLEVGEGPGIALGVKHMAPLDQMDSNDQVIIHDGKRHDGYPERQQRRFEFDRLSRDHILSGRQRKPLATSHPECGPSMGVVISR